MNIHIFQIKLLLDENIFYNFNKDIKKMKICY